MKNKELFDRTIAILVKAYFNNTLEHSICGCAVGNLICENMSIKIADFRPKWNNVFCTTVMSSEFDIKYYHGEAKTQIDSTGYNPYELASIEKAFETGDRKRVNSFNGLMSVVDCLMQIHEATTEEANEAKALFVKV